MKIYAVYLRQGKIIDCLNSENGLIEVKYIDDRHISLIFNKPIEFKIDILEDTFEISFLIQNNEKCEHTIWFDYAGLIEGYTDKIFTFKKLNTIC